jgi:AraC-like DNA-binding protein
MSDVAESDGYVEFRPPPALRPFVQRLWVHRLDGPPPAMGRRLLPDGQVSLVWIADLGARIAGPQTSYLTPPNLARMLVFGASFYPGAAPYVLRTPAPDLRDRHISLDAIDPRLAARLDDRLGHARDVKEAIAALADELARAIAAAPAPDPAVREAVRLLDRTSTTVADAAAHTFVSERELERRFTHDVGYGPKTLHRVLRFQRFMRQLWTAEPQLATAAALAGYADQSHLTREARRLSGLTPRQLLSWTH